MAQSPTQLRQSTTLRLFADDEIAHIAEDAVRQCNVKAARPGLAPQAAEFATTLAERLSELLEVRDFRSLRHLIYEIRFGMALTSWALMTDGGAQAAVPAPVAVAA